MPSDKHNLRMARARDLNSWLINVPSSWDVPFHQAQHLQCLYHGATYLWTPLCPHPFFTTVHRWWFVVITYSNGFSVRHKYHWDTSHSYNIMKWVQHCWNRSVMAFMHRVCLGNTFHKWVFRNGWVDCRGIFYVVLCLYCSVTNRT